MNINIKLTHPSAKMPVKAHPTDACFDLYACAADYQADFTEYDTGICLEIPEGYCALVYPRSSVSNKGMYMCNSVGVIDAPYRNSIKVRFYRSKADYYEPGDRIAQLMIVPVLQVQFQQTEQLTTTDRSGGFGSSGNK